MELLINRIISDNDATVSTVSIDGNMICFGLEDEYREVKVAGETRIPAGTYQIGVRTVGGFHGRYQKKYPNMHQGMLQVMDVPGFEYILIHCGNTDDHTDGCLLVGLGTEVIPGQMKVTHSNTAYKELYPKVIAAALAGDLTITYIDNDR